MAPHRKTKLGPRIPRVPASRHLMLPWRRVQTAFHLPVMHPRLAFRRPEGLSRSVLSCAANPGPLRASRFVVDQRLAKRRTERKSLFRATSSARPDPADAAWRSDCSNSLQKLHDPGLHPGGLLVISRRAGPVFPGPPTLGNRLTVDPRTLTPLVLVRIQVPQPTYPLISKRKKSARDTGKSRVTKHVTTLLVRNLREIGFCGSVPRRAQP